MRPVLPGFHPDPSVIRVGDDYYLATSSFEYFPGVPLFHSRDLESWEPIGHVFPDIAPFHVPPGYAGASRGFFAPTLRFHAGVFHLVTTSISDLERGQVLARAPRVEGPWSPPVFIAGAVGIDPDLTWDGDTCYLTWKLGDDAIAQARVDLDGAVLLEVPRTIWRGTGLAHPEGPHLYRRHGWWYLVIAEGGTDRGHVVSVARSRSIDGPFEAMQGNPALTHRSTSSPLQSTGHADLVERPDGTWAALFLGVRPRGRFPRYHLNGRETFLADVAWRDDWPSLTARENVTPERIDVVDELFESTSLHTRWVSPSRMPHDFARPTTAGLALSAGRAADETESRALLCTRVVSPSWLASADVEHGDVALVVRIDDLHWAGIELVDGRVRARIVIGGWTTTVVGGTSSSRLAIRAVEPGLNDRGPDRIELGHLADESFVPIAHLDGRYLSTEVAGGYTGRMVGVESLGGASLISRFRLEPLEV